MADEHLIGTLTLELAFPDLVQTDRAIPDADRLSSDVIVPVLESVVREYDGVDLSLDQVEIDLGSVTEKELPSALAWAFRNELDRRLGSGFRPILPDADISVTVDAPVAPFTAEAAQSPVEQLTAYLSEQAIPWDEDVRTFDPVALFDRALTALAGEKDLPAAPAVAAFVSRLLPLQALRLAELARRSERFPEILEQMDIPAFEMDFPLPPGAPLPRRMTADLSSRMAAREALWRAYRGGTGAKVSSGAPSVDAPSARPVGKPAPIPQKPTRVTGKDERPDLPEITFEVSLEEELPPRAAEPSLPVPASDEAPAVKPPEAVLPEPPEPPRPARPASPPAPATSAPEEAAAIPPPAATPSPDIPASLDAAPPVPFEEAPGREPSPFDAVWEPAPEESEAAAERIPLSDAGLVLVHPFIGRFLQNMGLVDRKGQFVSDEARIHAVHLLRHVTGYDDEHLGHRLILEKVLCGLPVDYLVPEEWEATPEEDEEVEGLLTALLSHWPTLRKSSVGALQRGFLQRPGEIARMDGSFIIRVEGSAMDILMHDLPWENSIILLSWLDKPIFVEWQH